MPFTFAHPAIVLPLAYLPKKWISLTGLIIGSMIPDFEYFIRMRISCEYSHTLSGVFWFDLPLAILVAFIFHNIVRNSLYNNLPHFLQVRFNIYKEFNWNKYFKQNWLVVIISVLIGIFSHLLWDSFTHETGYFAEKFQSLSKDVSIFSLSVPVFKILQHGSTLTGGLILLFVIIGLPKGEIKPQKINPYYWITFILIIILVLGIRLLTGLDYKLYGQVIVNFISATMIALIITPLLIKKQSKLH